LENEVETGGFLSGCVRFEPAGFDHAAAERGWLLLILAGTGEAGPAGQAGIRLCNLVAQGP